MHMMNTNTYIGQFHPPQKNLINHCFMEHKHIKLSTFTK